MESIANHLSRFKPDKPNKAVKAGGTPRKGRAQGAYR